MSCYSEQLLMSCQCLPNTTQHINTLQHNNHLLQSSSSTLRISAPRTGDPRVLSVNPRRAPAIFGEERVKFSKERAVTVEFVLSTISARDIVGFEST